MRVAYVSVYDAKNVVNWSGSGYFIWQSLFRRGVEVVFVGPLLLPKVITILLNFKKYIYLKVLRKDYLPDHDVITAKIYAQQVRQKLSAIHGLDAVVSPGSIPIAFLPGDIPLITISDATHKLLFDSYPFFKNLSVTSHRHGKKIEQAAIDRAAASVFASEWAAESAVRDYGASPSKVHVVPFGANFECEPNEDDVHVGINSRRFDMVRLLFIGVEWNRKGGPVAVAVLRALIKNGVPAHLVIVGCIPEISADDAANVTVRGFIKKDHAGQEEMFSLLKSSHFLIVPSEAECYGLVYCEASALGVPSIARNVGGVSTIIKNDVNGRLFQIHETADDIAEWILRYFNNPDDYRRLAKSSLGEYRTRLNWTVAGQKLEQILRNVVGEANSQIIK